MAHETPIIYCLALYKKWLHDTWSRPQQMALQAWKFYAKWYIAHHTIPNPQLLWSNWKQYILPSSLIAFDPNNLNHK